MNDKEYLEFMAKGVTIIEHESDCGQCEYAKIQAQAAKDFLETGNFSVAEWAGEVRERWEKTKYYKLWLDAGKPEGEKLKKLFEKKGWLP